MAQMLVSIAGPLGEGPFDVELPDDATMNQLVPQLLPALGLSPQGSFSLKYERTSKILGPNETLKTAGVQAGDKLTISAAATAAAEARSFAS